MRSNSRPWTSSSGTAPSHGHWKDLKHQREKLEEIGKELGAKELNDWYKFSRKEVYRRAPFIQRYYGDVLNALKSLFPHHSWNSSSFATGHWENLNYQRQKLEEVGEELGVKQLDDWYKVSPKEVARKTRFIQKYYGDLPNALKSLFPH